MEELTITIDPESIDLGLQEDLENAKTAAQIIDVFCRITGQPREVIRRVKLRDLKLYAQQIAEAMKGVMESPNGSGPLSTSR